MHLLDLVSVGVLPVEFQLSLLEAALRALSLAALASVGLTTLLYLLFCLAEFRRS